MHLAEFCVFNLGSTAFLVKDYASFDADSFAELVYSFACDGAPCRQRRKSLRLLGSVPAFRVGVCFFRHNKLGDCFGYSLSLDCAENHANRWLSLPVTWSTNLANLSKEL